MHLYLASLLSENWTSLYGATISMKEHGKVASWRIEKIETAEPQMENWTNNCR